MKTLYISLFATLCSWLFSLPVYSQSCNCNFTITKSGAYSPSNFNAQPGQTICVQAGTYTNLSFNNFQGNGTQPILIKNCGGQVIIQNTTNAVAINFSKSKFIKITGSGDATLPYGFKVAGTGNNSRGISIADKSSNIEVEKIEIQNVQGAGIVARTELACDSTTWRDYYTMSAIKIHDNYVHDVVGEGIAVGEPSYGTPKTINCNGVSVSKFTHLIVGLEIYNNIFEHTGSKGIQYANSPDAQVHHNMIKNCGKVPGSTTLNNAVAMNGGAGGNFYNNTILDAEGAAIVMYGFLGNQMIYNNLIVRPKGNAIFSDSRPGSIPDTYLRIAQNTIISPQTEALKLYSSIHNYEIVNNIMLNSSVGKFISPLSSSVRINARKNYLNGVVDASFYENTSAENYRPLSHAPVINKGENLSAWGITTDITDQPRPNGGDFDIGCFESASAVATYVPSSCDYTVIQSGDYSALNLSAGPGNTVCIQAGTYTGLKFIGLNGTANEPIIYRNLGGQVIFQNTTNNQNGLNFDNCRYFKVTGTGDPNVYYGLKVAKTGSGGMGITVGGKSSDCEIEHVEISNTGFAGIMAKTDPNCDSTTWRGNFTMYNIKIHDNYIHDVPGEGLYIGNSFAAGGMTINCNGVTKVVPPHNIYGLQVYNNQLERTGCEGIQFGCSVDALVHDNTMVDTGISPFDVYQANGIQIGGGSGGLCYNNTVVNARGTGIIMVGFLGNQSVFNNVIVNSGYNGIFADSRSCSIPNTYLRIANNSIIGSASDAIKLYSLIHTHEVVNNLIANPATGKYIVKLGSPVIVNERNNFKTLDISQAQLNNPSNGNYYPIVGSPLVNTGENLLLWGISFDRDNNARPYGSTHDIGAFELIPPGG